MKLKILKKIREELANFWINNNIKTYFQENFRNLLKNKDNITSYKTKSQNKHKSKEYQTLRNKIIIGICL